MSDDSLAAYEHGKARRQALAAQLREGAKAQLLNALHRELDPFAVTSE